jgi:hypothetical protein
LPSAFNPKPFIADFEATVGRLLELRKEIQQSVEQKEKGTRRAELDYSRRMTELNSGFDVSYSNIATIVCMANEPATMFRQSESRSITWRLASPK